MAGFQTSYILAFSWPQSCLNRANIVHMVTGTKGRFMVGLQERAGTASWPSHNASSVLGLWFLSERHVKSKHPRSTQPCSTRPEMTGRATMFCQASTVRPRGRQRPPAGAGQEPRPPLSPATARGPTSCNAFGTGTRPAGCRAGPPTGLPEVRRSRPPVRSESPSFIVQTTSVRLHTSSPA